MFKQSTPQQRKRFSLAILAMLCLAVIGSFYITGSRAAGHSVWTENVDTTKLSGDGPSYYIETSADLAGLASLVSSGNNFSGKTIYLSNDIDLGNKPWAPIGTSDKHFQGTFDGQGFTVSGLYISCDADNQGLFGYISNADNTSACVRNLTVKGTVSSAGNNIGGIVGCMQADDDVYVSIISCVSRVAVKGGADAGGVVGCADYSEGNSSIADCVNSGSVSAAGGSAGGVVGLCIRSNISSSLKVIITNCLNLGRVSSGGNFAGGISGCNGTVSYCTNMGAVSGTGNETRTGGIAGIAYGETKSCASVGNVSGPAGSTGAIIGYSSEIITLGDSAAVSITNSFWYANDYNNSGLKAVGGSAEVTGSPVSRDSYSDLVFTYAPAPYASKIMSGKTKAVFRTWPGTSADAVTSLDYTVSPDSGITVAVNSDKSITATITGASSYKISADVTFTPSTVDGNGSAPYTANALTYRVAKGTPDLPERVYVTPDGTGEGTSWSDAMGREDFESAFQSISKDATAGYEFWLKKGTYSLTKSLPLAKGIKLYGGFAGTESALSERSLTSANATVLSRDLGTAKMSIVTGGAGATSTDTVLDGFTITGGNGGNDDLGGGMYNNSSSPTVINCTFSGNSAIGGGGGMCNYNGSGPTVKNSLFDGNYAENNGDMARGGGMFNEDSSPIVENCTFVNNYVSANSAMGGGMANYAKNNQCNPVITNCTFTNNNADKYSIGYGGGICNFGPECKPVIANSIFWNNQGDDEIKNDANASPTVAYCVVKSGDVYTGTGNTNKNPYFGNLAPNGGPVRTVQISAGGSAFRAGMKPGDTVSGDIKVPTTDARGVAFDAASADIGAYTWVYGSGSVTLSADKTALAVGETATVKYISTVKPLSSDTDEYALETVKLASSNASIAALSGTTVTAKALGTAVISVDTSISLPFTVDELTITVKESISTSTLASIPDQTYTGSALTPAVTVSSGDTTLVSGTDYTVSYSNNTNVGTATVTVTGKGNYTGTKTANFKIVSAARTWATSADISSWYNKTDTSYTITTPEQLAGLAALVNSGSSDMTGKTITISGDLDLSGADWTPIGTSTNPFNGTFGGNGSTVTNLSISDDTKDNVGFIGVTGKEATVKDVTVSGDVGGKDNVGVLVGTNNGTITNCTTSGTTNGAANVGGITGVNNGTVASSVSEAEATATAGSAGGIAGTNTGAIANAASTGTTTADIGNAGGVAGTNSGTIADSTSTGTTSGDAATTGGITGDNTGTVTSSNWITDTDQPGTGSGTAVSSDCITYTTATSNDMPITTVTFKITDITTDENGGFWITAAAYPNTAKNRTLKLIVKNFEAATAKAWTFAKAAWSEGTLTLTPDAFEADGTAYYIQTSGDKGKYTIRADRAADSKELAEFTLSNTKEETTSGGTGSGGSGGCNAGAAGLAMLALCVSMVVRKKK